MKQRDLLFLTLGLVGGYSLIYYLGKNRFMWGKMPIEKKESPEDIVEVTITEPQKLSANASVTQPQFARQLFNRDWVLQSQVKVGFNSKSPFN